MGVLQRSRHRKAVHDRGAAISELRDASGRLGSSVARLARATQDWSSSQAALALEAAGDSEAVARARHAGGTLTETLNETARGAQESVVSTAKTVRKRGLRTFDVAVLVAVVALRKRLQSTRAARQASRQPSS